MDRYECKTFLYLRAEEDRLKWKDGYWCLLGETAFLEYKYRMGSSFNENSYTAFNSIKLTSSAWDPCV